MKETHMRLYVHALMLLLCLVPLHALAQNGQPAGMKSLAGSTANSTLLRGFTVGRMRESTLEKAANTWHANSIRYMMRTEFQARVQKLTYAQSWQKIIDDLPGELDQCKKLNMTAVLCLFELPNDNALSYPKGKAWRTAFWADDSNKQILVDCWKQIAQICKDRDQDIWFEILNEPLDWKDMPHTPAKWSDWAQAAIDAIRVIDAKHPVVIEVGPGGLCWAFKDFTPLKGDYIIYASHQYQPHEYTHQGISNIKATDLKQAYLKKQQPWPGAYSDTGGGWWDKNRLALELKPLIDFQKKYGVRVYISEFSAIKWAPDAEKYLRDSIELYEELGWDWAYHALDEYPGWSLEHTDAFDTPQEAQRAKGLTERGKVVKQYMDQNVTGNTEKP
jgi:hypothetical protein